MSYETKNFPLSKGGLSLIYDSVAGTSSEDLPCIESFSPNPFYERYLKMHKVFVGRKGAEELLAIHDSLKAEEMPRFLSSAGWAAAEAAVVMTDIPSSLRLSILESGQECWRRALQTQKNMNGGKQDFLIEDSAPYRIALDIATAPLLRGIILGNVTSNTVTSVYEDILGIAEASALQLKLAVKNGNYDAVADHVGFGYECNALLLFNKTMSKTWFAIPSMIRSDTGYHHRNQTHDILIINQKWGDILSVIPMEVKASAGARDRKRYDALLVRGKMHLSAPGKYRPEETLDVIKRVYDNKATPSEAEFVDEVSSRITNMAKQYYQGEYVGIVPESRTPTSFRDIGVVAINNPGLGIAVY